MKNIVKTAKNLHNAGYIKESLDFYKKATEIDKSFEKAFAYNIQKLEEALKEATSIKTTFKINSFFDHIYVVNLEKDHKKRGCITKQLDAKKIRYELWKATNGYEHPHIETWNQYQNRKLGDLTRNKDMAEREAWRKKHYIESPGAIGYIKTYCSIIKDAKEKKYKNILILEDDITLANNFEDKLSKLLNNISKDWKLIHLGASQYNWDNIDIEVAKEKGYYHAKRIATCGSFAMAISANIYDQILIENSYLESPFDLLPLGNIYKGNPDKCYVAYPNLALPDVRSSNIRDGRNQINHSQKMHWDINSFDFPPKPITINLLITNTTALEKNKSTITRYSEFANINLYINSVDGPRPIHSLNPEDYTTIKTNNTRSTSNHSLISSCDICIDLDRTNYLDLSPITTHNTADEILKQLAIKNHIIKIKSNQIIKGRCSVIIPTYKRSNGISEAIKSATNQNQENIEILVIDDNNPDTEHRKLTEYAVREYQNLHPQLNIKYIKHSENRNGSAARNTGIMHATGEYISFLDDDDIYLENRVIDAIETMKNTAPIFGGTYCGFLGWNSPADDQHRYPISDLLYLLLSLQYKKHYLHTNTITLKRSTIEAVNGFDETFRRHQDLEFNTRILAKYNLIPTSKSAVRLKVNAEGVDNRILGSEFIDLKKKFFRQIQIELKQLSENEIFEIYSVHAKETLRLCNTEIASRHIMSDKSTFNNALFALLLEEIKSKNEVTA